MLNFYSKIKIKDKNRLIFSHVCKQVCGLDFKVKVQICQCVERCHVTWNLQIRSKMKLTKERFGKKTLIKTVLDFLLGRKKGEFLSTNTSPRLESVGI